MCFVMMSFACGLAQPPINAQPRRASSPPKDLLTASRNCGALTTHDTQAKPLRSMALGSSQVARYLRQRRCSRRERAKKEFSGFFEHWQAGRLDEARRRAARLGEAKGPK